MRSGRTRVWRAAPMTIASAVAAVALLAAVPAAAQPLVGMNLNGLSSIHTQWDFVDLMKSAEPWRLESGGEAPLDGLGNPIIPVGDRALTNVRLRVANRMTSYPTGLYTLTWEGTGEIFLTKDAANTIVTANGPGSQQIFIDTNDADGTFMRINESDPMDPIRNVRLLMPTYGPGEANDGKTFHDLFVHRLEPFGVLRFMDWSRANGNTIMDFADRTQPDANMFTQNDGVPVEHMVTLANTVGSDPWFTMPALADDDYVRQFAEHVRDNLDPARKVYVEYGNEVWAPTNNGGVVNVQHEYVEQQAVANGLDPNLEFHLQWAAEAMRDFDIWLDVFAGQEDRVVRVAAAQGANRFLSPMFFDAMYRGGERQFDVLSMAAYVGADQSQFDAATTADDIIDALFATLAGLLDTDREVFFPGEAFELDAPKGLFAWHGELAEQHGVPLIAYEGGQNLFPGDPAVPWFDAYLEAERDPRMFDLYTALLEAYLNEVGAEGFLQFTSVRQIDQFGAWGALEFQDQPFSDAPKHRALLAIQGVAIPEPASAACLGLLTCAIAGRGRRRHAA